MIKFKLSDKFLSEYEGKQPKWGYGDLSYLTYARTYSRIKPDGTQEEFFDTIKRVVEGCFTIQLSHCNRNGLHWDAYKAQRSAQKMFQKIWEFKFTPPGRGLWMMGTPVLEEKGSAALFNCAAVSTADIKKDFGDPFAWAADMLMFGVGVGYDLKGAGTLRITKPQGTPVKYTIPDSREGWVESVRLLINSYSGTYRTSPVEFDYSLIRKAGEPIKGFGGISSGPGPLIEGHQNIRKLLDSVDGEDITSVNIVDIMNFIGKFIVAGNIRRSAELSLGDMKDKDYLEMKDFNKYPYETNDRRWLSNNSVYARKDSEFEAVIDNICLNGEPGLVFQDNIQAYGRIKDGANKPYQDNWDSATLVNPCIPNYSKFLTKDRGIIPLSELVVGDTVWTGISWSPITKIWSTGIKPVYRYTTSGGYVLDCTQNHRLLTRKGKVEAKDAREVIISPANSDRAGNSAEEEFALLAGLVQGDGSKQKNGGTCAYLNVGTNDLNYYDVILKYVDKKLNEDKDRQELWKLNVDFKDLHIDYKPLPERTISDFWLQSDTRTTCMFLRGLFSANGSKICDQRASLKTTSKLLSEQVQLMLSSVGIKSYITTNKKKEVEFSNGTYMCKESYDVNITQTDLFMHKIGFLQEYKNISHKGKDRSHNYTRIVAEEYIGDMEVWDFTVKAEEHTAWVNGTIISNCAEICLENKELCNLCEVYPAHHDSQEEFFETLKYAYLYSKTVTLLPTHDKNVNAVIMRNRRLGISQTGVQQAIKKFGHSTYYTKYCDEAYTRLKEYDKIFSRWLGIPTSIRLTTCKPSGTVSLLAGSTPGVHFTHSEYYIRTVRLAANSNLLQTLINANYKVEYSVTDNYKLVECMSQEEKELLKDNPLRIVNIRDTGDDTLEKFKQTSGTLVIYFPVKEENFTKSKYDVTIWEQLSHVREMQTLWADNAVSVTVTIQEKDKKDLISALEFFSPYVKTLSFLPLNNHGYLQAPYITCTKEEYTSYKNSIKPIETFSNNQQEPLGERYCSNDRCEI